MEAIHYKTNERKKYGVRIARYISLFNDTEGNPTSVHYDFSQLQYVRSDDLNSFTEICKQLFDEFQIMEFTNVDFTFGDKVVYTTPLLSQILEIDKDLKDKMDKSTDELKIKNREWLATVPKSQVLYKFSSGTKPYLVLVQGIYINNRTGKEGVRAGIYLCESVERLVYENQFYLYHYVSKDGRVLKKKFCNDYKNYGYLLNELEFVASKLTEFNTQLQKLGNLLI